MKIMPRFLTYNNDNDKFKQRCSPKMSFGIKINSNEEKLIRFIDKLEIEDAEKPVIYNRILDYIENKSKNLNQFIKQKASEINHAYFSGKSSEQIIPDYSKKGILISDYTIKKEVLGDTITVSSKIGGNEVNGSNFTKKEDLENVESYFAMLREAISSSITNAIDMTIRKNPKYIQNESFKNLIKNDPKAAWANIKSKYNI